MPVRDRIDSLCWRRGLRRRLQSVKIKPKPRVGKSVKTCKLMLQTTCTLNVKLQHLLDQRLGKLHMAVLWKCEHKFLQHGSIERVPKVTPMQACKTLTRVIDPNERMFLINRCICSARANQAGCQPAAWPGTIADLRHRPAQPEADILGSLGACSHPPCFDSHVAMTRNELASYRSEKYNPGHAMAASI